CPRFPLPRSAAPTSHSTHPRPQPCPVEEPPTIRCSASGRGLCPRTIFPGGGIGRGAKPPSELAQAVLVKTAALHDGGQVPALLLEQAEVAERVAVDDEEIGEGAGGNHAELAFLAEQPGGDRRG